MEYTPLISVIVPVYNVEKYLPRCVDSILCQTYSRLQIILVDDGSPDGCPGLLDEYAQRDSRIKVIHQENGGLSRARNAGMAAAEGEYIGFIDSDDYVSEDFFEVLLTSMLREGSDIAECTAVKVYEDEQTEPAEDDMQIKTYSAALALSALISEKAFHQHVWNKLYKAELALKIPFEEGKLNEDEFWTYQVFGSGKKATKINKTMYYYFQRSGSIMGTGYSIRRLDALEGKANRQRYIDENYPELSLQSKIDMYSSCIFAYQSILKYMKGQEKRQAAAMVKGYLKSCEPTVEEINTVTGGEKKYLLLAKRSFYLCCKLKAIFNIGF